MVVDARVMRLLVLIISSCLLAVAANTHSEKEKQKVLEQHGLLRMDISAESRSEFNTYMGAYCLTHMSPVEFLTNYIRWEGVEFLDSVREFLDPTHTERGEIGSYFHHLGHEFITNCSIKNDTLIRDSHDQINYDTLFDNYMYDMMTRHQWTGINL